MKRSCKFSINWFLF